MSGGGGIIIINGKNAAGQRGPDYQCVVASAQAAYDILVAHPSSSDTAFVANLLKAINDANS